MLLSIEQYSFNNNMTSEYLSSFSVSTFSDNSAISERMFAAAPVQTSIVTFPLDKISLLLRLTPKVSDVSANVTHTGLLRSK